jgi:hypothetical protein
VIEGPTKDANHFGGKPFLKKGKAGIDKLHRKCVLCRYTNLTCCGILILTTKQGGNCCRSLYLSPPLAEVPQSIAHSWVRRNWTMICAAIMGGFRPISCPSDPEPPGPHFFRYITVPTCQTSCSRTFGPYLAPCGSRYTSNTGKES